MEPSLTRSRIQFNLIGSSGFLEVLPVDDHGELTGWSMLPVTKFRRPSTSRKCCCICFPGCLNSVTQEPRTYINQTKGHWHPRAIPRNCPRAIPRNCRHNPHDRWSNQTRRLVPHFFLHCYLAYCCEDLTQRTHDWLKMSASPMHSSRDKLRTAYNRYCSDGSVHKTKPWILMPNANIMNASERQKQNLLIQI
jgi:hypothetical protein